MAMIIDGVQIKTPTSLEVRTFRISRSERLANGDMAMDIVAVKRRLDLAWNLIKDADLQHIMELLESGVFHTVTYPDPHSGEGHTITVYVGDTGQEVGQRVAGTRYWTNVSIALIER